MIRNASFPYRQSGTALIVALIFLLVMTLIGSSAMRSSTLQERMSGNARDWNLAFQSAEAALREGEQYLLSTPTLPDFIDDDGYYQINAANRPVWIGGAINDGAGAIAFGTLDGLPQYGTPIDGAAAPPRYYFEELSTIRPPGSETETGTPLADISFYRVTAIGFGSAVDDGGTPIASTVLSSVYRSR